MAVALHLKPVELATGRPAYDRSPETDNLGLTFEMIDTTVTVSDEQAILKLEGACRH
jgi:hypothetical protein